VAPVAVIGDRDGVAVVGRGVVGGGIVVVGRRRAVGVERGSDLAAVELADRDRLAVEGGHGAGGLGPVLDPLPVPVGIERIVPRSELVAVLEPVTVGVGLLRVRAELELLDVLQPVAVGVLGLPGALQVVLGGERRGLRLLGRGGGRRRDQRDERRKR